MTSPLVSIVCLCYNHERFVKEAIDSVLNQTYSNIELVVVDDCSTDQSVSTIKTALRDRPQVQFIANKINRGNCRAFNDGFRATRGMFVIDLAADDVLMPDRVERGIRDFESHDEKTGVTFSDAQLIGEQGEVLGLHSDRFPHAGVPQGDIYAAVLRKYFINSPTMMMRREVLERLGGYDEALAYEDFDFWVRSSREFHYSYIPEPLVKRRMVTGSLGKRQFKRGEPQLHSTFQVCRKAAILNRSADEVSALKSRVRYELRRCLQVGEWRLALDYFSLYRSL